MKASSVARIGAAVALSFAVAGCDALGPEGDGIRPPTSEALTQTGVMLRSMPPPQQRIDVAVYGYEDETGQQKPNENFAEFSKAVTQGSDAILVDVLKDVSRARWFNVVERGGLQNLLTERNLIEQSHRAYRGAERSPLPSLRFAGIILEGGIVNYDSNTVTGGAGSSLLGIGSSQEHRRDNVTVFLRAVSVASGEVLESVTASKTIYSTLVRGSVFRFVSSDELFELEAGYARNEPVGLAVRQAIELAVYSLIMEGARSDIWTFRDRAAQAEMIERYNRRTRPMQLASAPEETKQE